MALHTDLPIYKVAYDLLDAITDLARNMPRDFKQSIGGKMRDEAVEITVLIFRANCAQEKAPFLVELVERQQVAFEQRLEANLCQLDDELRSGTYKPGKSICFVITRPKPREVWAAEFRDRIVHHLLYNRISSRFYASFIADSCACIPGRGTLYGAQRLEAKIRSITQNWSKPAHYLKLDLANFFVSKELTKTYRRQA